MKKKQKQKVTNFLKALLITSFLVALTLSIITPIKADAPEERQYFLPKNADRELTIVDKIRIEARKAGLDEDIMIEIAYLESKFNPEARLVNKNRTVDRGIFQINDYWHKDVSNSCSYDIDCNIKEAMRIAKKSGYIQWVTYNKFIK